MPPRLFLDVFAGHRAPVTAAVRALGLDYFQPFDLDLDASHNILNEAQFRLLQQLAWSGLVAAAWFAPPCKEYSRLKLRRPGPRPLRTP